MLMGSSTLAAILACLLASTGSLFVSGSPTSLTLRDGENINLGTLEWKGVLEEGKPEVFLKGNSFDDIERQAKALNPAYTIFTGSSSNSSTAAAVEARSEKLLARQTEQIRCDYPRPLAFTRFIWDGVSYLRRISGDCRIGGGNFVCGRVSCSYDSAIYYCNDNPDEHWEPCRWIGDVAAEIINLCRHDDVGTVGGEARDHRRWYTQVKGDDC